MGNTASGLQPETKKALEVYESLGEDAKRELLELAKTHASKEPSTATVPATPTTAAVVADRSAISVLPLRGWTETGQDVKTQRLLSQPADKIDTGPWPVPLYKYSRLFPPSGESATVPGCIMAHGFVYEGEWAHMQSLAEEVAAQGFAVLLIGMRDDDEEVLLADFPDLDDGLKAAVKQLGAMGNAWPAKYYSKALSRAIDQLLYVAPKFAGVTVDAERIALVGCILPPRHHPAPLPRLL